MEKMVVLKKRGDNKLLSIFKSLIFLIHFLMLGLLFYFLLPFSNWYLQRVPALGIDLFYSATSVRLLQDSFSFWFNGFKTVWFAGYPLASDFPRFHFYMMIPFANYFGTVLGVQYYFLFTLLLLLYFSYLLFYKISKNIGLAFLLTIVVMLSVNIYGAATWGGSIPYFADQFFLPLVLFFIIHFFQTSSSRWLWAAALFAGLSFLFHPLPAAGFILPLSTIAIIFYPERNTNWQIIKRIKYFLKFLAIVTLVSFTLIGNVIIDFIFGIFARIRGLIDVSGNIGSITSASSDMSASATGSAIADFYRDQVKTLITGTDKAIFPLIALGLIIFFLTLLISFIFNRKKYVFFQLLSFLIMTGYVAWHAFYNLTGHSFFSQALYRAFWPFPIIICGLIACLWSPLFNLFQQENKTPKIGGNDFGEMLPISKTDYFPKKISINILFVVFGLATSCLFIIISYLIFINGKDALFDKILTTSDTSSAFPEVLSFKLDKENQDALKKQLLPSFINPNDKNRRLYESDATVNIWWNYMFDVPLVRGYIDPPIGTGRRGSLFLLDIALGNNTLVRDFKFTESMAKNYALYLIDWYAVNFFEGGHVSPSANVPLSTYLDDIVEKKEDVITHGAIWRYATKSGRPEPRYDLPQTLKFSKIKDEFTSVIAHGSDAPAVLVISDFPGYEQIWRMLAAENLNSRFVITVNQDKFIDSYNRNDLKNFDAIILHNYDYYNKSKAFRMLQEYVKEGGKVFIDTGGEIKDSQSNQLDELLPVKSTERKELSKDWGLEVVDDPITSGIDFSKFGPPIFNNDPWKFSYPVKDFDLRDDSKVILKNNGKPILIVRNYGLGKVIWSGMNLPYHFNQYNIVEEEKFFKNILGQLIEIKKHDILPVQVLWKSPENITIKDNINTKGILVKEELYDSWTLNLRGGSIKYPALYKAGPTYPGFMYIPLNNSKQQTFSIDLKYHGLVSYWVYAFVSLVSIIVILEKILFNGKFILNRLNKFKDKSSKVMGSWWEKEEE